MWLSTTRTRIPTVLPPGKWWTCLPTHWPRASNPLPLPLLRPQRLRPKTRLPPPPESRGQFSPRRNKNRTQRLAFREPDRELAKDAGLSVLFQPVIRGRVACLQLLQLVADALSLQAKARNFLAALSPVDQSPLRLFQQSLVVRTDGGVNRKLFHDFTLTFLRTFTVPICRALSVEGGVHVSGHSSKSLYLIELATRHAFLQSRSSTQES